MRKFLTACSVLLFLSAQSQFSVGMKGGISIPRLKGNNEKSEGYTSRLGIYGGVQAIFPLSHTLSLQPEVNFSPQGGQRKGMQPIPSDAIDGIMLPPGVVLYANFKNTAILNYLEIPVLLKLAFERRSKLTYYACFGPHIAFLLEAKTKTSGKSSLFLDKESTMPLTQNGTLFPPVDFNSTTDIKESIKKVNAGIQGGVGIEHPIGNGNIFFDARAIIGMLNIQTHPEEDGKNKTGSFMLAIGYSLIINK
ncbi:porin family protein [Terrimonas alba]|uniref:porin family protein n=1 Tax=Terrimonas alba TaxID=3349636 RepID=UPI0035F37A63